MKVDELPVVKLEVDVRHLISISQIHYIDAIPKINPDQYAEQGMVRNMSDCRAALRQAPGAWIWDRQTRHVVGFNVTRIATDAVSACLIGDLEIKIIPMRGEI